ncbi:MAG: hypothetical protein ABSH33_15415 [Steroidobacteraceae bacterium]|jgi:hypothetical protein
MDGPLESLGRSPELFPYSLDAHHDTVAFIRLRQADYDGASFLDARILTAHGSPRTMPWRQVAAWIEAAAPAESCRYLFHIGHVGSTLLSRLIGAHPRAFALREPLILRQLADIHGTLPAAARVWSDAEFEARLGGYVQLLSRTFDARQRAVVKATSFVSELASRLLARPAAPRAVLMFVSPESYLATILGGPNSRQEAQLLTPARLRRLHRRIGEDAWRLESFTEGEALALGWACEMSALAQAAHTAGERVLCLNFDEFLAAPQPHLLAVLRHLHIDATAEEVREILAGPHMQRYSKAPEHAYDAALRREVLNEARALHGAQIERGLRWLERAAARFAAVRGALAVSNAAVP